MLWKQLFAKKSLEMLLAEMKGENRLRRILGPIQLSALGIGAIIGAGIFVMTGRAAAQEAGPAIMVSYCVAGIGCAFAAFCYAEFASMAPVAGSAYTYSYATLGELFAWIIGWDLILEYAMSCACVAASWSKYFNAFLNAVFHVKVPEFLISDPFSHQGAWFNMPAVAIMIVVTIILVIGIRESATTNAILVAIKTCVVLFVIAVGWSYIDSKNWTAVSEFERKAPEERAILGAAAEQKAKAEGLEGEALEKRASMLTRMTRAWKKVEQERVHTEQLVQEGKLTEQEALTRVRRAESEYHADLPKDDGEKALARQLAIRESQVKALNRIAREKADTERLVKSGKLTAAEADRRVADVETHYRADLQHGDQKAAGALLPAIREKAQEEITEKWGLLSYLGMDRYLVPVDDSVRSPFAPFGLSGIMLGASIVFFAFIGFDSISAHSEEAKKPQRDVPIGILTSLAVCTVLYLLVSAVITGMERYPSIDPDAAIASAFLRKADMEQSASLKWAGILIATGALAGMTSVLLITFLSQARIFLAMARDGLLPQAIFGAIHPRFRTPHISTMLTGAVIVLAAAFTPINKLEEMVNIGTLLAFVMVCTTVWVLRIRRPDAHRPFRAPFIHVIAPLGIVVNLIMMLFLPIDTWARLVIWLAIGLVIYFSFGVRHSVLGKALRRQTPAAEV